MIPENTLKIVSISLIIKHHLIVGLEKEPDHGSFGNCTIEPRLEDFFTYNQKWKKLTKYHLQNSETEKLAHKICAKNAQKHAILAKMAKIAQKKPKTFNKTREKTKVSTAVKNLHTRRGRWEHLFHL